MSSFIFLLFPSSASLFFLLFFFPPFAALTMLQLQTMALLCQLALASASLANITFPSRETRFLPSLVPSRNSPSRFARFAGDSFPAFTSSIRKQPLPLRSVEAPARPHEPPIFWDGSRLLGKTPRFRPGPSLQDANPRPGRVRPPSLGGGPHFSWVSSPACALVT